MIIKGKSFTRPSFLIYGASGTGKSTFGAQFSKPIFIGNEVPMEQDVDKYPQCKSIEDVEAALKDLKSVMAKDPKAYGTLVIDSLDGLQDIFRQDKCYDADITPGAYGRDKGEWGKYWQDLRKWLVSLKREYIVPLQQQLTLVWIAHERVRTITDLNQNIDYREPDLENRVAPEIQNYVDAIFYLMMDAKTYRTKSGIVNKVTRKIHTVGSKYWMGKNRWGLSDSYEYNFDTVKVIRRSISKYYAKKEGE